MANNDPQRETLLATIESQGLLAGRFENIRRLGTSGGDGTFSLLMTADDRRSRCRVALKFFHPGHLRNQYRWSCFAREPTVLQLFTGERDILQCFAPYDEFTVPFAFQGMVLDIPFAYYAVELAERDVNQVILGDQWTARQKLDGFRAMCRAIQRIHGRRVVHRDLKPGNFLIMSDGTLRLSDFGTARDLGDAMGAVANNYQAPPGERTYAAPELIAVLHDVDPAYAFRADVYSLGAILFELFSGTPLFLQVFDWATIADLQRSMQAVDRALRVRTYDAIVGSMADARPLPSVAQFGGGVPNCIVAPVNRLYRAMAAIDYRRRLCDFSEIFARLNTCLWVLQHEQAYQRLRELRARVKQAREAKERLLSATRAVRDNGVQND